VTAVYVLRATRAIFWGPGPSAEFTELHDARGPEWAAPIVLGAAIILFGLWPRLLLGLIDVASGSHLRTLGAAIGGLP